jgi:hypothetical protein
MVISVDKNGRAYADGLGKSFYERRAKKQP